MNMCGPALLWVGLQPEKRDRVRFVIPPQRLQRNWPSTFCSSLNIQPELAMHVENFDGPKLRTIPKQHRSIDVVIFSCNLEWDIYMT
jgi:hypothetical protein